MADSPNVVIIAHRGNGPTSVLSGDGRTVPPELAPENTLAAFRRANAQGADGIEFDVIVTRDGKPVVVHDDELNRNVEGAARKGTELGKVSEKTLQEVQQYNVGQGERIPSLDETLNFFAQANAERATEGKPPLIANIEIKAKTKADTDRIVETVREHMAQGGIDSKSVIFCSFNHELLAGIKAEHPDLQIAPSIKSATLFGKENVDEANDFSIKPGAKPSQQGLDYLQAFHERAPSVAMDAVLWDIRTPLVDLAKKNGIQLHASTSDFRDYAEDPALFKRLDSLSQEVPVFFKADEPAIARQGIELARSTAQTVNLQNTTPLSSAKTAVVSTSTGKFDEHVEKPQSYSKKRDGHGYSSAASPASETQQQAQQQQQRQHAPDAEQRRMQQAQQQAAAPPPSPQMPSQTQISAEKPSAAEPPKPAAETPAPVKPTAGTAASSLKAAEGHAGKAVAVAGIVTGASNAVHDAQQGNYGKATAEAGGVALATGMVAAQQEQTWEAAARLGLKGTRAIGEKIPVVGAVVAGTFGLYEIGSAAVDAIKGKESWTKVGTVTAANVAETGGGLFGFGGAEAARQTVVEVSKATVGERNAPSDSASVALAKAAFNSSFVQKIGESMRKYGVYDPETGMQIIPPEAEVKSASPAVTGGQTVTTTPTAPQPLPAKPADINPQLRH